MMVSSTPMHFGLEEFGVAGPREVAAVADRISGKGGEIK